MEILCHRGWWTSRDEQNTQGAFERGLTAGFGCEVDVSDYRADLVVSHDPPMRRGLPLADVLALYRSLDAAAPLAINIKADGLHSSLAELLRRHKIESYFVFDM